MNPQHFKELLYSVCLTTHTGINKLAKEINISQPSLWEYSHYGVPVSKKVMVINRLKEYLRDSL